MDNLTPQLNDQQLRENIDSLQNQGMANDKVQSYVDNYQKGSDGNYVLKTQPQQQNPIIGGVEKVGKFLGDVTGVSGVIKGVGEAGKVAGGLISGHEYAPQTSPTQFLGSVGKVAANTALAVGTGGESIPAMAALGGGLSASEALEKGNTPTLGGVATGAAVGGALPLVGKGLGLAKDFITNSLPERLVNTYLPAGKDIADHVIENTKLGTTRSMFNDSTANVKNLSGQINDILKNKYGSHLGNGSQAIQDALAQFSNSNYSEKTIINTAKNLVPESSKLIDKLANGTATLPEKNTLRSALDQHVQSVYTKFSVSPARKEIGAALAGALRNEVQSTAAETKPLFNNLSKEITLKNALLKQVNKSGKIGLTDILSGIGGFLTHGPIGGAVALGTERAVRSPAVGIGVAKGLSRLGEATIPQVAKNIAKTGILQGVSKATNSN